MSTNRQVALCARNGERTAQWRDRWLQSGGSFLAHANPLPDLRNAQAMRDHTHIQYAPIDAERSQVSA